MRLSVRAAKAARQNPQEYDMRLIQRLVAEETGQDLIEYALLASFISLVAVSLITSIGGTVNGWYVGYNATIQTIPGASSGS
jgi:Flp pilus assembly pilin Flp